jgi:hypothetical protein
VSSTDLNRFRGDNEGNEGVGNDVSEPFLRGCGDSGRNDRAFRIPLFLLCFVLTVEGGGSAGKLDRVGEDWIVELRNTNEEEGSEGWNEDA